MAKFLIHYIFALGFLIMWFLLLWCCTCVQRPSFWSTISSGLLPFCDVQYTWTIWLFSMFSFDYQACHAPVFIPLVPASYLLLRCWGSIEDAWMNTIIVCFCKGKEHSNLFLLVLFSTLCHLVLKGARLLWPACICHICVLQWALLV